MAIININSDLTIDGTITATGVITATVGNSTQWSEAYNWGDHSTQGYLTSESDSQTLSWDEGSGVITISGGNTIDIRKTACPASTTDNNKTTYRALNEGHGRFAYLNTFDLPTTESYILNRLFARDAANGGGFLAMRATQDGGLFFGNDYNGVGGSNAIEWHEIITTDNIATNTSQFLRSDVSDLKSAGTLTFADDVKLQIGTSSTGAEGRLKIQGGVSSNVLFDLGGTALQIRDQSSSFATRHTFAADGRYTATVNNALASNILQLVQKGTGDAALTFYAEGIGDAWTMGIDYSDARKFKIATELDGTSVSSGTKLTIDTSGKVGINNTAPSYLLDVSGVIRGTTGLISPSLDSGTGDLSLIGQDDVRIIIDNANTNTSVFAIHPNSLVTSSVFEVDEKGNTTIEGTLIVKKQTLENKTANYTLLASDLGKLITTSGTSNITITVDTALNLEDGGIIEIDHGGTGTCTIAAGTGVTLQKNSNDTLVLDGQWSRVAIQKMAADDTYRVFGQLTPA